MPVSLSGRSPHTHSLTHSLTHPLTHSLTPSLVVKKFTSEFFHAVDTHSLSQRARSLRLRGTLTVTVALTASGQRVPKVIAQYNSDTFLSGPEQSPQVRRPVVLTTDWVARSLLTNKSWPTHPLTRVTHNTPACRSSCRITVPTGPSSSGLDH